MVVGSGCWFVGRSSRILHYHDRLARSPNLSRSGSNRAFRPLRKSGNDGIHGIDGKGRPIRASESLSMSLRGLTWLTSWYSFFHVFRVFRGYLFQANMEGCGGAEAQPARGQSWGLCPFRFIKTRSPKPEFTGREGAANGGSMGSQGLPTLLSSLGAFCLCELRVSQPFSYNLWSICSGHGYPARRAASTA